jgi:hypothetical protein
MHPLKFSIADSDVVEKLAESAVEHPRNGEPLQSEWSLDAIAVLPGSPRELHIVEQHKHIGLIDQIKIS